MSELAELTMVGALSIQVCVPSSWTDEQVLRFAESEQPCGTSNGWQIRTDVERLAGMPSRNPCSGWADKVHITLDA